MYGWLAEANYGALSKDHCAGMFGNAFAMPALGSRQ